MQIVFFTKSSSQTSKVNKIKSNVDELEYAWDSNSVLENSENDPTFYAFSNDEGFVIVAAEDNAKQIIGYSLENSISTTEDIPEPMKAYLSGIDAEIKLARTNTTLAKAPLNSTIGNVVKHIETANWGQNAPFNRQCVTNSGATAKTGCIPTAFAIIMKHHEWPNEGVGNLYNSQTGLPITDRTYNWSNTLMSYSGSYTEEQANEVAKIMSHVGHAYMVTYGTGSTNGNTGGSTDKLNKYFAYKNVSSSLGRNFDETTWKNMIKESIQNNCPIPYESTNSGTGDSKHIFVLDGYTDNDYFHFNWGWNGYQNGYFILSAMLPGDGDNYSGLENHKAFFNLAPDRSESIVTATISPNNAGKVSINGCLASENVSYSSYENATVTLSAVANSGYTFSNWSCEGEIVSTQKSFQTKVSATESKNIYTANFLVVGTTDIYIPINYNSDFGTITCNGNAVNDMQIVAKENQEITLRANPYSGYTFDGWEVTTNGVTQNYNTKDISFVATNNMEISATFTLAITGYIISKETGTKTNSSGARSSRWAYTTSVENPVALQLTSTNGTNEVYALSNSYDRYYAYAYDSNEIGYDAITYTLSVPNGYVITGYNMVYWVPNSYKGQITVSNETSTNTPTNTEDQTLQATELNTQSTSFTISASKTGQQYINVESFVVSIKKEGSIATDLLSIQNNNDFQIFASNGVLHINGYKGKVKILNIAGQITKEAYCNNNIQLNIGKGIFIVATEKKSLKVCN